VFQQGLANYPENSFSSNALELPRAALDQHILNNVGSA
jgi:hypothetical protein